MANKLSTATGTISTTAAGRPPMVISYLRFSRDTQSKGDSIRRQTQLVARFMADRGWGEVDKPLHDHGVSAFRGANADEDTGHLGRFLALVKAGRIPKGSVLLVECLDRLTREEIQVAFELFLGIINGGVTIVTLAGSVPTEFAPGELDLTKIMLAVMQLYLANEESRKKRDRLLAAWEGKRLAIADRPLTGLLPAWCKLAGGKVVLDDDRAEVVRGMFRMALDGHGLTAITKHLNATTPIISRRRKARHWGRSYVAKILTGRAAIGEYQPCKVEHVKDGRRRKRRTPIGEPIANYFPAVVDSDTFHATQAALGKRRTATGPVAKYLNLFKGLLHTPDGDRLQMQDKGDGRQYVPARAIAGVSGAEYIAFPVAALEVAFFAQSIDPATIGVDDERTAELTRQLDSAEGRMAVVAKRLADIEAAMLDVSTGDVATMVSVMGKLTAERNAAAALADDARQQLAARRIDSPAEAATELAEHVHEVCPWTMDAEKRNEVARLIRRVVSRMTVKLTRPTAGVVRADATVQFETGVKMTFTAEVDRGAPDEVRLPGQVPDRRQTSDVVRPSARTSADVAERVRALWADAVRPVVIAQQTGVSLTQVYRLAKGVKRVGQWRPASRWDAKRPTTPSVRPGATAANGTGKAGHKPPASTRFNERATRAAKRSA